MANHSTVKKAVKKIFTAFFIAFFLILFYIKGPGCPIKALTGIPCMGCGMTRAYISLLHGDLRHAFYYHPAFPLVPAAIICCLFHKQLGKRVFFTSIGCILAVFAAVYFWRIATGSPITAFHPEEGYLYRGFHFFIAFIRCHTRF